MRVKTSTSEHRPLCHFDGNRDQPFSATLRGVGWCLLLSVEHKLQDLWVYARIDFPELNSTVPWDILSSESCSRFRVCLTCHCRFLRPQQKIEYISYQLIVLDRHVQDTKEPQFTLMCTCSCKRVYQFGPLWTCWLHFWLGRGKVHLELATFCVADWWSPIRRLA